MAFASLSPGDVTREMTTMAKPLLSDELWAIVEPLLPERVPSPKGGGPPSATARP